MATYIASDSSGNVIQTAIPELTLTCTGSMTGWPQFTVIFSDNPGSIPAEASANPYAASFGISYDGIHFTYGWDVIVSAGINDAAHTASDEGVLPPYPSLGPPLTNPIDITVTFGAFNVELRYDVEEGEGWVNGVPDEVPNTSVRYYWYIIPGQSLTSTITWKGFGSATQTSEAIGAEYIGVTNMLAELNANDSYGDESGTVYPLQLDMSISYSMAASFDALTDSVTNSAGGMTSVSLSPGSITFTQKTPPALQSTPAPSGTAYAYVCPDLPVNAAYEIMAMGVPYPDSLSIKAVRGGGSLATPFEIEGATGAVSASQQFYSVVVGVDGTGFEDSANTYGPVSLSITTDSLATQGEDYVAPGYGIDTTPRITRLPFRSQKFPAISVAHAESFTIPDWNDLDYWAGTNGATVTQDDSGNIVITATDDATGGATFTYPFDSTSGFHNALSCLSYRFLNVTTPKGVSSPAFTLTIPPCSLPIWEPPGIGFPDMQDAYTGGSETPWKQWNVGANDNGLQGCDGDVDLCGPNLVKFGTSYVPLDPTLPLDRGTRWPIPSRMMA